MTRPDEDAQNIEPIEGADAPTGADEVEFSLEQLSQAYAKVIRGQATHQGAASESETVPSESELAANVEDDLELANSEVLDPVELDDRRDDAPCRITETSVLESILFVGAPPDVPLTAKRLASMMRDISPKEIPGLVDQLNQQYAAQNAAYRVISKDKAFQFNLYCGSDHI